MNRQQLQHEITLGEDSTRQFKSDIRNAESLAAEMAAFANSEGGTILIGVADDGLLTGLSPEQVSRINQLIGNAASQLVRSPLSVRTENVSVGKQRVVIVLTVPKGIDKPYFDKNGVIWLKTGSDKRYVAKGLLPYHGLGSGIQRALEQWPQIEFVDDHDGCLFRVTVTRKPVEELDLVDEDAPKTTNAPKIAPGKANLTGQTGDLSGQPDPINDLLNAIRKAPDAELAKLPYGYYQLLRWVLWNCGCSGNSVPSFATRVAGLDTGPCRPHLQPQTTLTELTSVYLQMLPQQFQELEYQSAAMPLPDPDRHPLP